MADEEVYYSAKHWAKKSEKFANETKDTKEAADTAIALVDGFDTTVSQAQAAIINLSTEEKNNIRTIGDEEEASVVSAGETGVANIKAAETTGVAAVKAAETDGVSHIQTESVNFITLTGNQAIDGVKTFNVSPQVPTVASSSNDTTAASTAFVNSRIIDVMNTGSLMPFAGSTAPSGWLKCDGSAISRTTYADLFAVIGTTYGAGDGSTTFNIPNLTGARVLKGSSVPVRGDGGTFKLANSATGAPGNVSTYGNASVDGSNWMHASFNNSTLYVSTTGASGMVANISSGVAVNYIIKY